MIPPSSETNVCGDVLFGVISDVPFLIYKRSIEVLLEREASEYELRKVAWELKRRNKRKFLKTFIGYYLPGMKIDGGYWATTHFTPDLEVRILGKQQVELESE